MSTDDGVLRVREGFAIAGAGGVPRVYAEGALIAADDPVATSHADFLELAESAVVPRSRPARRHWRLRLLRVGGGGLRARSDPPALPRSQVIFSLYGSGTSAQPRVVRPDLPEATIPSVAPFTDDLGVEGPS